MKLPSHFQSRNGVALILVLFAVLGLSFLIVLFFTVATNTRTNTSAYVNTLKVEELATGGLELVVEELRKEITDGTHSTAHTDPNGLGPTVYTPTDPQYILPERSGTNALGNLFKSSLRGIPLYTGGQALASAASTLDESRNGRSIALDRWNKPALSTFTTPTSAPDWIYLGRQGPVVDPSPATAANPASSDFVLGRIAFNVYDVAGLLDLNVAGYPDSYSDAEAGRKGSTALARLQALGFSDEQVEKLIAFRNPSARADYHAYLENGDHEGFTKTLSGDNRFLSRQELIRFATHNAFADKLPLLTIFSREKNAPSYRPDTPTATNPDLTAARHTTTGRLLYETRFPLSKLKLFADPGTNPVELKQYFGLTYNTPTRSFTYVGQGSSPRSQIKTLAEIAAEPNYRQPDFFETLKAAILEGSIGQSAGQTASVADDPDKDTHVMQIGANIIDQYDLDPDRDPSNQPIPIPTTLQFAGKTLYGVEDLPYVNKISFLGESPKTDPVSESFGNLAVGHENSLKNVDAYSFLAAAELWNPSFQSMPATPPNDGGPQIQVSLTGKVQITMYPTSTAEPGPPGPPDIGQSTPPHAGAIKDLSSARVIAANANLGNYLSYDQFSEPHFVRLAQAMDRLLYNKLTEQSGNSDYLEFAFNSAKVNISEPLSVTLAVLDENGIPRPYQQTLPIQLSELDISETTAPNHAAGRVGASSSFVHSDPRTNRLGYFGMNFRPSQATPVGATSNSNPRGSLPQFYSTAFAPNNTTPFSLRPRFDRFGRQGDPNGYGIATTDGQPQAAFEPLSPELYLGLLWENTLAATRIQDPDGEYRLGDGGFAPSDNVPNPMEPIQTFYNSPSAWPTDGSRQAGTNASRPVHLDRPFRSIADLGYVHRDIPWRSLNFSSTDSGDAALLDIFSLEESSGIAGRINLNSAPQEVLQSLIAGSLKEENTPTSTLSESQASAAADRILEFIENEGPILNLSDLVTKFSTPANLTDAELGNSSTGESSFAIKTQRESLIRALAGSSQTRTWNLLIDLIAQTGKIPATANSLDDFVVAGERRYWLHVAIDRYTGEVVAEMLETVVE